MCLYHYSFNKHQAKMQKQCVEKLSAFLLRLWKIKMVIISQVLLIKCTLLTDHHQV